MVDGSTSEVPNDKDRPKLEWKGWTGPSYALIGNACERPATIVKSPSLAKVAKTFDDSRNRLSWLIMTLPAIIHWSDFRAMVHAVANFLDSGYPVQDPATVHDEASRMRIHAKVVEIIESRKAGKETFELWKWPQGVGALDNLMNSRDGIAFVTGLQAFMTSIVVLSWTLFETLVADLWEASVNSCPKLAFTALGAEPFPTDDEDEVDRKKKTKFTIPAWMMKKYELNLSSHMGTILIDKWDFANRLKAADAYYKAFGDDCKKELKEILESESLRWLAATRNCIVHCGGYADIPFTKLVAGHPKLATIKEAAMIVLDVEACADFVKTACDHGDRLVQYVDTWLLKNSP